MADRLLAVVGEDHPDKGPLPGGQLRGKVLLQKFLQLQRLFDCILPSFMVEGGFGLDTEDHFPFVVDDDEVVFLYFTFAFP